MTEISVPPELGVDELAAGIPPPTAGSDRTTGSGPPVTAGSGPTGHGGPTTSGHLTGHGEPAGGEPQVADDGGGAADSGGFAAFYRREYPGAVRLAWLLNDRRADGEDLVQEAFAAVAPRFAALDNPAAYLRTAVVNRCRESFRRRSREQRRIDRMIAWPVPAADASDTILGDERLLALVAALPPAQRAVLVLRYWSDLPDAEIADALGVRPATVRSLAFRAMRRLEKELPR